MNGVARMRSRLRRVLLVVIAGLTLASGLAVAALALYARRPEAIAAALASEAADPVPRPAGVDDRVPGPMERLGHWLHARFLAPSAGPVAAAPARGFVLPAPLGAPTTVALTVRDAAGAPVAGARVALYGPPGVAARDAAVTDAAGLARFEGVPAAPGYAVAVARAGRPTVWRAIDVPDGGAVEVRLEDARRLRGRVIGEATSQPVAGARVRLIEPRPPDPSKGWTPWTVWERRAFGSDALATVRELATVTSDATGAFEATVDGPAVVYGEAHAPDGRSGLVEVATAGRFASPEGVEVPVAPPATVRGRLRDAAGAPIRDVLVRAVGAHLMRSGAPSRTDAEGRFEVVAPETDFDGTLAWTSPDGTQQSTDAGRLVEGGPVELIVPADPVVEVVVTDDATGAPVAGADVIGTLRTVAADRSTRWAATGRSDATGVARLRLPAGELVGVLAVAARYGDARRFFEDPEDGDRTVRRVALALRRTWAVTGAVRLPGGAPAVGARVRADVDSWRAGPEAVTDANGRFRLEGVRRPPPERADDADPWLVSVGVRAWLDGVGDARGRREFASDAAKGPEVDVGTLTLEAPAVLVGRVVDAEGRPVAGARVASERGMLGLRFDDGTESDAAGRFALALGAARRADETLAASADGARRGLLAVRGGVAPGTAHEVRTIVVASAPTLRISVRDGATAVRGVVALMPADATLPFVHRDSALRAPTAADGTVELRHVVSGPARLVVWDAAGGTWSRPLDVRAAAGAPVEVAVRLPPSAPITGRVVDDAGVPVPWAELLVTTCAPEPEPTGPDAAVAAPDALPSARADAEGRFRLAPVPVGRAALVVRAAHHRTARPDVVVVPAREVEVRLARFTDAEVARLAELRAERTRLRGAPSADGATARYAELGRELRAILGE